jgi:hypothetical protein
MVRKQEIVQEDKSFKLLIKEIQCWKCHHFMKLALLTDGLGMFSPSEFGPRITAMALEQGVKLEFRESATAGTGYRANVCPSCNQITGDFFLHNYYYEPDLIEIAIPDFDWSSDLIEEEVE